MSHKIAYFTERFDECLGFNVVHQSNNEVQL